MAPQPEAVLVDCRVYANAQCVHEECRRAPEPLASDEPDDLTATIVGTGDMKLADLNDALSTGLVATMANAPSDSPNVGSPADEAASDEPAHHGFHADGREVDTKNCNACYYAATQPAASGTPEGRR